MGFTRGLFIACTMLICIAGLATLVAAQTNNRAAARWFERGRSETEPAKQIEAFQKAIELDPEFVLAMTNLAMVYKENKDLTRAEEQLKMAVAAMTNRAATPDLQYKIFFELSKIYSRTGNVTEAEKLLREAKKLNVGNRLLGILSSDLGRLLYNQGRYLEALDEFKLGRALDTGNKELFDNLIDLTEKAIRVEETYANAERERRNGNLRAARSLYAQIQTEMPGFRNVESRLAEADSLLAIAMANEQLDELYQQARKHESDGNFAMAIANYESILQREPGYKDVSTLLEGARSKFALRQKRQNLEQSFQEGLEAFRSKDWPRAIATFESIVEADSSFSEVVAKLAETRRLARLDTLESTLHTHYTSGLRALENDDLSAALDFFTRIRKLNPEYKNVSSLITVIEQASTSSAPQPETAAKVAVRPAHSEAQLDSLYMEALAQIDQENWIQAIITLEKIRILAPDFRDVSELLSATRGNLARQELVAAESSPSAGLPADGSSTMLIAGGIILTIFLPLLAFVALSPMMRARFYLLQGKYNAAALIYESALAKNPGKLKLYPKLATAYLHSGRRDETAMNVYKTIVKLNLVTDKRAEINSLLTTSYLEAGKTDDDAISVLESALKREYRQIGEKKDDGNGA